MKNYSNPPPSLLSFLDPALKPPYRTNILRDYCASSATKWTTLESHRCFFLFKFHRFSYLPINSFRPVQYVRLSLVWPRPCARSLVSRARSVTGSGEKRRSLLGGGGFVRVRSERDSRACRSPTTSGGRRCRTARSRPVGFRPWCRRRCRCGNDAAAGYWCGGWRFIIITFTIIVTSGLRTTAMISGRFTATICHARVDRHWARRNRCEAFQDLRGTRTPMDGRRSRRTLRRVCRGRSDWNLRSRFVGTLCYRRHDRRVGSILNRLDDCVLRK